MSYENLLSDSGWASFIISQNMKFVGIGMIGVAIIVDTLSALRRKRYDEYQIVLLEKVFLFNGLFTAVLFPLSLVVLILAPMYFVETIFALILFQWIASIKLFFGKVHITGLLPLWLEACWDMFVQSSLRRLRAIPSSLLQFLSYPFLKQPSWQ